MFYKAKPFNYLFGEKREGWMEAEDKGHDAGSGKETFAFFHPSVNVGIFFPALH